MSAHSKPQWNAKLSELALEIKKVQRRLKLKFSPPNKAILVDIELRMKEEVRKNNNRWNEKRIHGLNDTNSSRYFRAVKRFNGNNSSEIVRILIHDGEKRSFDAEKAKIFEKTFFQVEHLRKNYFGITLLGGGAVSVVNVALKDSRSNLERYLIKDNRYDINGRITMNKVVAAISRVDSSKGADPFGLHPRSLMSFQFFYAQLNFTPVQTPI